MDTVLFEKQKIFEQLDYKPQPDNYKGLVPWKVQQQISATNGIHFKDSIGKLNEYPIPAIPIKKANEGDLFLDIGCGWGRWLVAAGRKDYIPIGIDLRLEFCNTSREVLKDNGLSGYTVVGDLKELPFKDGLFSAVWSFSVIQHTHKDRLTNCIQHIYRILKTNGFCCLEFPNRDGWRNRLGPVKHQEAKKDDYNSWCVRYYTVSQYREMFEKLFSNFSFKNHSFLGIGVLPNDLKFAKGFKSRFGIAVSLALSGLTKLIKPLKYISDSIYVQCDKKQECVSLEAIAKFKRLHELNPDNNLNILCLLRCPISGGELLLDASGTRLISEKAKMYFPVVNNTPILVPSQAIFID